MHYYQNSDHPASANAEVGWKYIATAFIAAVPAIKGLNNEIASGHFEVRNYNVQISKF